MPRRLGQHFLTSRSILNRIAEAACPTEGARVVEIGPGRGALTEFLLPRAVELHAIEVDTMLIPYLEQRFRAFPQLHLHHADVLKTDLAQWGPVTIAGNLPYYITSPITQKVLALGPLLTNAVFLVQREVAERMAAHPGTRDYGYLSVLVQFYSAPKVLFHVPPGAFSPPPKVESSVIQLTPRAQPAVIDPAGFLSFVSLAFHQKRKTLRNNLAGHYPKDRVDALPEAPLRAEQLPLEQFVEVYQRILEF